MNFKNITLRCDCNAEAAVFTRYDYEDGDISYGLSFEDSYKGNHYKGLLGRFRRAWKAFIAKPVVHMDVFTDDESKMKKFLKDCLNLMHCEDTQPIK